MTTEHKSRDEIIRKADDIRAQLFCKVEQLDQRRHEAFDMSLQLRKHLLLVGVLAGATVVTVGAIAVVAVHHAMTAPARRRRDRWRLLVELWSDPRHALRESRRPFSAEIARSIGLNLVTAAAMIPMRRLLAQIADPPRALPSTV